MTDPQEAPVVLAVDDEVMIVTLIEEALKEAGYHVRSAISPTEAIAMLEMDRARDLSGLVTDVNLGSKMSGWEIARRARELNPALPVVYVTGDSEHEWESKGVPNSTIISKPFAPVQIVVALASLANQSDH